MKPRLRVAKTAGKRRARQRAGDRRDPGDQPLQAAVRNMRTGDNVPAGLDAVSASPKVTVSKGRYCWTAKRLAAGKSKRFELPVRALPARPVGPSTGRARAPGR